MNIDLVDYEAHYRRGERLFGAPNRQFVRFLAALGPPRATVLDLGCGQGRDALAAARLGHQVVGVDLSPTGIRQMLEDARAEGLQVAGVVADIIRYRSRRKFAVVMLDRVLHLLPDDAARHLLLARLAALTKVGGFALVAVNARYRGLVHRHFDDPGNPWRVQRRTAGFVCAQHT